MKFTEAVVATAALVLCGCYGSKGDEAVIAASAPDTDAPKADAVSLKLPSSGPLGNKTLLAYMAGRDADDQPGRDKYTKSFDDNTIAGRQFWVDLGNDAINSRYDADAGKLTITISLNNAIGVGNVVAGSSYFLPFYKKAQPLPTRTMENAFGVKKEVTGEDTTSYGLGGVNRDPGLFKGEKYSSPELVKTLLVSPDRARALDAQGYKASVKGAVISGKSGHTVDCGSYTKKPDIESPIDGTDRYCVLSVKFRSATLMTAAGEVLGHWGTPSS